MCMIQTYDVIYPDGTRQPREALVNCEFGTPSRPCRNVRHDPAFRTREATPAEINAARDARSPVITPPGSSRTHQNRRGGEKPKSVLANIAKMFGIRVEGSKKRHGSKGVFVRSRPRHDDRPARVKYPPPAPTPPPYHPPQAPGPSMMPRSPIIGDMGPPREYRHREPQGLPRRREPRLHEPERDREPRRRPRRTIVVHDTSSQDESPSPPKASREHIRKTRSLSPKSRYEAEKRAVREKERQQHMDAVARQERDARDRAVRLAEGERRNQQQEEEQRRIAFEERKRIESAERIRQRQRQEENTRREARHDAMRRQQRVDGERIRAAERQQERDRMAEQENERRDRLRRANIPRQPRHPSTVHGESFDDRGERFIRDSIEMEKRRTENLRRFERERWMPPTAFDRYEGAGVRRRNTIDGGRQRRRREFENAQWYSG